MNTLSSKTALLSVLLTAGVTTVTSIFTATSAQAFVLTSKLTGDPRLANPDELAVNVSITSGENGVAANQALWTVDLDSPLHPDIKLGGFFFNLANSLNKSLLSFSGFDPSGWTIASPADNAEGSGSADFQFGAGDPPGQQNNVTNTRSLTFLMTYAGGVLTEADFLNASSSTSSDNALGSGQLGAHLQSLTVNNQTCPQGRCGDSGFALGNYEGGNNTEVPEPGAVIALGLVAGGGFAALRKKQVQATQG